MKMIIVFVLAMFMFSSCAFKAEEKTKTETRSIDETEGEAGTIIETLPDTTSDSDFDGIPNYIDGRVSVADYPKVTIAAVHYVGIGVRQDTVEKADFTLMLEENKENRTESNTKTILRKAIVRDHFARVAGRGISNPRKMSDYESAIALSEWENKNYYEIRERLSHLRDLSGNAGKYLSRIKLNIEGVPGVTKVCKLAYELGFYDSNSMDINFGDIDYIKDENYNVKCFKLKSSEKYVSDPLTTCFT